MKDPVVPYKKQKGKQSSTQKNRKVPTLWTLTQASPAWESKSGSKVLVEYRVASPLGFGNPFWSHHHLALGSHPRQGTTTAGPSFGERHEILGCPILIHTHIILTRHCMGLQGTVKRIQLHSYTKGRANPRLKPRWTQSKWINEHRNTCDICVCIYIHIYIIVYIYYSIYICIYIIYMCVYASIPQNRPQPCLGVILSQETWRTSLSPSSKLAMLPKIAERQNHHDHLVHSP